MSTMKKTGFAKEVEAAARNNPGVDMDQVREWRQIAKMLEQVPPPPEPEPAKPPRLQPIPLEMFSQ